MNESSVSACSAMTESRRLYEELGGLPSDEQERHLNEHCPDPELRRTTKRRLRIQRERKAAAATNFLPHRPVVPAASPPACIGPYRVREELGRGAFGKVYLRGRSEPLMNANER